MISEHIKRAMERRPVYATPDNHSQGTSAKPKRAVRHESLGAGEIQKANSPSDIRIQVHVRSFRRRLLDEDNLVSKFHNDGLRYCGLLPTDAPQFVSIRTTQEKVATKDQERTEITLSHGDSHLDQSRP